MTRGPVAKALEYGLTQAECGKLFGEHTEVWIIHFEKYRKEIACYPFECVHVRSTAFLQEEGKPHASNSAQAGALSLM